MSIPATVKIIDSLEVAEFPVAAQQELLKLNDVGIFRRHFKRYPKVKFCNRVDVFIIRSGDRKFAAGLSLPSTGWTERWRKCCWTATTFT